MKNSFLLLIVGAALLITCKSDKPVEVGVNEGTEEITEEAGLSCYLFATDRDTVFLKLNQPIDGKVTGDLKYDFYERDGNVGYIEGEIHGDTLIADYTFLSEGMISVREVGFLLDYDRVIEGYGDVEERDGRMFFWHKDSLDFSNGLVMPRVDCDQVPQRDYSRFFEEAQQRDQRQ